MSSQLSSNYVVGLYMIVSCVYSLSLPRQYKIRQITNRLIPEYWSQRYHHYITHTDDDAFNDYINELEDYHITSNEMNTYDHQTIINLDPISQSRNPETNENIKSYLEAPGYTVKMNENVFRKYLAVLLDLYGMNEQHEFGDGKYAIEELRQALKDEARLFFGRPISSFRKLLIQKLKLYKWEILKSMVGEVPLIGDALKLLVVIVQHERKAIKRYLTERWFERTRTELPHLKSNETIRIGLGEPFPLYVLRHWRPSDEDPDSIYNIKVECPIETKPKVVFDVAPKITDSVMLNTHPGKCVVKRKHVLRKQKSRCIGFEYNDCLKLSWCKWEYCNCKPWKQFKSVDTFCDVIACLRKNETVCGQKSDCEWG